MPLLGPRVVSSNLLSCYKATSSQGIRFLTPVRKLEGPEGFYQGLAALLGDSPSQEALLGGGRKVTPSFSRTPTPSLPGVLRTL